MSRLARLLLVVMLTAGSMNMLVPPVSAREVIKARRVSWTGNVVAKVGEKVIWKNPTLSLHNVKSYNQGKRWRLRETQLQTSSGNQVTRRFKKRGRYYFRCTLHSRSDGNGGFVGMVGIVKVQR